MLHEDTVSNSKYPTLVYRLCIICMAIHGPYMNVSGADLDIISFLGRT